MEDIGTHIKPVVATRELRLRKFAREDFDRLISWVDSPQTMSDWAAAYFTYPLTKEQLEKYYDEAEQGQRRLFTVVDSATDSPVGHIELSHIIPYLSGFVSRVLVGDTRRRNQGIGEQMVHRLLSFAFQEYGFHHMNLGVVTTNQAAIRCYTKIGFVPVGEWTNGVQTPTGRVSVGWMMLSRSDWESSDT